MPESVRSSYVRSVAVAVAVDLLLSLAVLIARGLIKLHETRDRNAALIEIRYTRPYLWLGNANSPVAQNQSTLHATTSALSVTVGRSTTES